MNKRWKERLRKLALRLISYLPAFLVFLACSSEAGTWRLPLMPQPQGVCSSESLLVAAIWISLGSYYPSKQGSATSLARVPQIWNTLCQRHRSGQKNIFPNFQKGVTSTHWHFRLHVRFFYEVFTIYFQHLCLSSLSITLKQRVIFLLPAPFFGFVFLSSSFLKKQTPLRLPQC